MFSNTPIRTLLLSSLLCIASSLFANNIIVTNTSLSARNTSAQTRLVQFNLSWQNSWRTSSAPFNWDAAWVFVKYKVGTTGDWKHATLSTTGHTIPSGATSTQSDATGLFIYRSADGTGTFSTSGIQLLWSYGTDGVANDAKVTVRVYAVEMVYNQVGGFQAGSGAINNGELRRANDVTATAPASTFTITGTSPTVQGNSSSASPTNIAAYNNTATDLTLTNTASLASGYPTGFNAFYAMKYEISQQQYVDFLNTLTYTQQAARTAATSPPNSAAGTSALINPYANRNGIDIQTPGTASTVPAVYACNLNGNGTYNESDDGQHIACNYLSWDDLTAYLDWAALRPMTELEYEKSCRGNQSPVASEYAWGNTSATAVTGLSNANNMSETASNTSANIAFTNAFPTGPVRNGIFATSSPSRTNSGAAYYGNMELSGNLWERVVTLGNATGRTFSGVHGNGTLTSGGASDVSGWPAAAGAGWKGGSWLNTTTNSATTSDRAEANNANNARAADAGGRGVRTISSGIVTDGLVLWLDAGNTPSYPGSGTAWTDLSGNKNNGTLTNGPTYSSANGGSIVFDGNNDYVGTNLITEFPASAGFTFNIVLKAIDDGATDVRRALIGNTEFPVSGFALGYNHDVGNTNYWMFYWYPSIMAANFGILTPNFGNIEFITFLYDGNTDFKLYRNGILASTFSSSGTKVYKTSGNLIIAAPTQGGWSTFLGNIYVLQGYNRALTAAEVLQNFNAQKARFGL
jgi:formylglycine-generating enzyme required for sulfatase activity